MSDFLTVSREAHDQLVIAAYKSRGYNDEEAALGTKLAAEAARHGIRTHHALKALHLDHLFGSAIGGCVPGAEIEVLPSRFPASEIWNANKKLGQAVAYRAIDRAIELADQYGIAQIAVDNAFHYLWGGGYVMEAAERGYFAYTNCTSTLAEVVPFGGKFPTLGTNPHSWGIPSQEANGFHIVMDWATATVAMGRVQALKREGKQLPPGAAVDKNGQPTTDPNEVSALLPFGGHKGYGMCLLNEIFGGLIGGSIPTIRGRKIRIKPKKPPWSSISTSSIPRRFPADISRKAAPRCRTSRRCSTTSSATATTTPCSPAKSKRTPARPPMRRADSTSPRRKSPSSTNSPASSVWRSWSGNDVESTWVRLRHRALCRKDPFRAKR